MTAIEILGTYIDKAIADALSGVSHADPAVLMQIHGFATPTMRRMFSNLCYVDGLNYLEVGTFCGATFISALNNNPILALGIDNFSQGFDATNSREQFTTNLERWKGTTDSVEFIDDDCFDLAPLNALKLAEHRPFDIYYYDGEHSYESQAKALPAFFNFLADRFIFIVDDWNWEPVCTGTRKGFEALSDSVTIEREWTLIGDESRSDHPIWWNGVAIFLCSKVK